MELNPFKGRSSALLVLGLATISWMVSPKNIGFPIAFVELGRLLIMFGTSNHMSLKPTRMFSDMFQLGKNVQCCCLQTATPDLLARVNFVGETLFGIHILCLQSAEPQMMDWYFGWRSYFSICHPWGHILSLSSNMNLITWNWRCFRNQWANKPNDTELDRKAMFYDTFTW